MNSSKHISSLTILTGLFLLLTGCNDSAEDSTAKVSIKSWDLPVSQAALVKKPLYYSSTGSVVTDQRVDVASTETGMINKILVANGKKVTQGQTLAIVQSTVNNQEKFQIKSPVSGIVSTRYKSAGDLVTSRETILTINLDEGFIFETYVTESQISKVKVNEKVLVLIDALNTSINGTVAGIASSGDPLTRRYRVKIILPQTTGLFPGMFGRSRFQLGSEETLAIPTNALIERGGLQGSFVVDKENKVSFRWLRIGKVWSENVEVLAGLDEGERIVNVNETRLRDGDLINSTRANGGVNE